jgi:multiple RNA-binding domain-containing protein 1
MQNKSYNKREEKEGVGKKSEMKKFDDKAGTSGSTRDTTTTVSDKKSAPPRLRSKTRVCIKSVPLHLNEAQIKHHIVSSCKHTPAVVITDVKLLRTPAPGASSRNDKGGNNKMKKNKNLDNGKSRGVAYLGFKDAAMASHVVEFFDKSFMGTSRIAVEFAFLPKVSTQQDQPGSAAGGGSKENDEYRPWSKYTPGSSKYAKLHPSENSNANAPVGGEDREKKDEKDKSTAALDKKKQEFLSVMQSRTKAKAWSNDDAVIHSTVTIAPKTTPKIISPSTKQYDGDSESSESDKEDDSDDDDDENMNNDGTGYASDDSGGEGADALKGMSDMDFLRSKVTAKDVLDSEEEEEEDIKVNNNKDDESSQDSSSVASSTSESGDSSDSDSETDEEGDKTKTTIMPEPKSINKSAATHTEEQPVSQPSQQNVNVDADDDAETSDLPQDASVSLYRLFIRNLPFIADEEDLRGLFNEYGTVTDCHVPCDDEHHNKGFAFVQFDSKEATTAAMRALDGTDFQGRLMHILPAKKSKAEVAAAALANDRADGISDYGTYKAKQEEERKAKAGDMQGWNASFVRGDAVVEGLADRLGVSKGDILNVTEGASGDAAVRLALGETHVINENRDYFSKHGVDMDILVSAAKGKSGADNEKAGAGSTKRSNTMILVKNLPYNTTIEELTIQFTLFQSAPVRVLLPPSKAIAAIEYSHANEAKKVFKKLAYKRFKHVPLYLEWVPLTAIGSSNIDVEAPTPSTSTEGVDHAKTAMTSNNSQEEAKAIQRENNDEDEDNFLAADGDVPHSIYVKNLNFSTTEDSLRSIFGKVVSKLHSVKIQKKIVARKSTRGGEVVAVGDAGDAPQELSLGYGFVELKSAQDAKVALKKLQGTVLDGHALELELSKRASSSKRSITTSKSKTSSKLIVRNVPFEATRTELLKLFGSFGQLRNVRVPKKFDGSHRGFAFVDYLTAQEAQSAMTNLSKTHLYGRHLVLEWADNKDDDTETLKEKAKKDLRGAPDAAQMPKNKKIRFE